MLKNTIKIIGLVSILGLCLSADVENSKYSKIINGAKFDKVIPCSNIPQKVWEADRFFANLKEYQVISCGNFIYRVKNKNWYIKN
jgi:hypothetical protein